MIVERLIKASKSSAQRLYVIGQGKPDKTTNLIDPKSFEGKLMPLDGTPQKKYIQALCKWVVKDCLLLAGNYGVDPPFTIRLHSVDFTGDYLQAFIHYGENPDQNFLVDSNAFGLKMNSMGRYDLVPALALFTLAEKKGIHPHDINSFPTAQNFVDYVHKLDEEHRLSEGPQLDAWNKKVEDYFKHHPQAGLKKTNTSWILPLTSFEPGEAMMKPLMGEDSHWCVTRKRNLWDQYVGRDELSYYLIISRIETDTMYMVETKKDVHGPEAVAVWSWNNRTLSKNEKMSFYREYKLGDSQFPWFEAEHDWKGKKAARVLILKYFHYLKHYFHSVIDPDIFDNPYSLFADDMEKYIKDTFGGNQNIQDENFQWPEIQLVTGTTIRPTHVIWESAYDVDKYLDSFDDNPDWELFQIYNVDLIKGWTDHVKEFWKPRLPGLLKDDHFLWNPDVSSFYNLIVPLVDADLITDRYSSIHEEFLRDLRAWMKALGVDLKISLTDVFSYAPWRVSDSPSSVTSTLIRANLGDYSADIYLKDLIAAVIDANGPNRGAAKYQNFKEILHGFARDWIKRHRIEERRNQL